MLTEISAVVKLSGTVCVRVVRKLADRNITTFTESLEFPPAAPCNILFQQRMTYCTVFRPLTVHVIASIAIAGLL